MYVHVYTVEPGYNESLYNEVLGITNDFLHPSNSKIHGKEMLPRYNESSLYRTYIARYSLGPLFIYGSSTVYISFL